MCGFKLKETFAYNKKILLFGSILVIIGCTSHTGPIIFPYQQMVQIEKTLVPDKFIKKSLLFSKVSGKRIQLNSIPEKYYYPLKTSLEKKGANIVQNCDSVMCGGDFDYGIKLFVHFDGPHKYVKNQFFVKTTWDIHEIFFTVEMYDNRGRLVLSEDFRSGMEFKKQKVLMIFSTEEDPVIFVRKGPVLGDGGNYPIYYEKPSTRDEFKRTGGPLKDYSGGTYPNDPVMDKIRQDYDMQEKNRKRKLEESRKKRKLEEERLEAEKIKELNEQKLSEELENEKKQREKRELKEQEVEPHEEKISEEINMEVEKAMEDEKRLREQMEREMMQEK